MPSFLKVFINESENDEAALAVNNVYKYVNGSSSLGVNLQIENVNGEKSEAKEFLKNCE